MAEAQTLGGKHAGLPRSPIVRLVGLGAIALLVVSIAISFAGRWFGHSIAMGGHTDSTKPFEIVIGNNVIVAPANMIRYDEARRDGIAHRLDLYLRWPTLDGYDDAHSDAFNNLTPEQSIIFASYEPRIMSRDMSGRLEPIYRALVLNTPRPGPAGLEVYTFSAKSGYVNEELVVGARKGQEAFVARCLTGESAEQTLAACQRDVAIGDELSLSYRFPARLLPDWRKLDAAVEMKARSMMRTARN